MSATLNKPQVLPVALGILFACCTVLGICPVALVAQQSNPAPAASRHIGSIKAISGGAITLAPDSGEEITVAVDAATRIVRIAPGEKDLKNAVPLQVQDLQVGDRILAAGKPLPDNSSLVASSIVVMKRADLQTRHQQDLQDWQKRGVDGLAKSVDVAAGSVIVSVRGKDIAIHTSASTVVRRYAPDSVKFDDAKASTLQDIHAGDQVRARGDRSVDGAILTAEEIVSGVFPFFAGTVNSVDASSSTISVHDLASKKNIVVRVTSDSQLRRLPAEMAQRIAARLKGASAGASATAAPSSGDSASPGGRGDKPSVGEATTTSSQSGAGRQSGLSSRAGAPDLQQILNRAPATLLSDLHKGDAVVILSTEGKSGSGTAIELFSGVEPILQAAPNAAQAMMLSPWNLGSPSADAGP